MTRGYSQKEISSTLQISQPTVSRDTSFIKSDYQREYSLNNTKTKFVEDYFMAQLTFDEIKKNLWQIVDNKKTKARGKIKALKQLANIAVESLEIIPILEIMIRVDKLNKGIKEREKIIMGKEKIVEEKQGKDKTKLSKEYYL